MSFERNRGFGSWVLLLMFDEDSRCMILAVIVDVDSSTDLCFFSSILLPSLSFLYILLTDILSPRLDGMTNPHLLTSVLFVFGQLAKSRTETDIRIEYSVKCRLTRQGRRFPMIWDVLIIDQGC